MKKITVEKDVAEILRQSEITENSLKLPGQLSRPDYVKVMKVIDAAGGKWNKKAGCHLFANDPRETFSEALGSGVIADRSEKTIRSEKQAFYTPSEVADKLIEHACIEPRHDILDPSAGMGGIASRLWAADHGKRPHVSPINYLGILVLVENDPIACRYLRSEYEKPSQAKVVEADFLSLEPPLVRPFERILMNPPFTKGQDVDHVMHAYKFLQKSGVLMAIMSPSFKHHSGKKFAAFREFLDQHGEIVEELNSGEFKESGTSINTVIVRIRK